MCIRQYEIVGLRFSVSPFVHLNTAYAKAQGVWTDTSEEYAGNGTFFNPGIAVTKYRADEQAGYITDSCLGCNYEAGKHPNITFICAFDLSGNRKEQIALDDWRNR